MARTKRWGPSLPVIVVLALLAACGPPEEPAPEPPCADGEILDDAGQCVPERCGAERWPAAAIEAAEAEGRPVIHVAPEGRDDGDGTAEDPLDEIDDAVDAAAASGAGLVAVADGRYEDRLFFSTVHDGVGLAGRCADRVVLDGGEDATSPSIWVATGRVTVSGLTITGGLGAVEVAPAGAGGPELFLTDVVIEEVPRIGVWVWQDGYAELQGCTIRGIQPGDDGGGFGVVVAGGGTLLARDTLIADTRESGVFAWEGGNVELERSTVRVGDEADGPALEIIAGSHLVARDTVVEGYWGTGVLLGQPGTTAELYDVTVREPHPRPNGPTNTGIGVADGAAVTGSAVLLQGSPDVGLWVRSGSSAELEGLVIESFDGVDGLGIGAWVDSGAGATLRGVEVLGPHDVGIAAGGQGTELLLDDAVVRGPRGRFEDHEPRGLDVSEGAQAVVGGLVVEDTEGLGVLVMGGSSLEMTGATIRDVRPVLDEPGLGVQVQEASEALIRDTVVEGCSGDGLVAMHSGTDVEVDGLTVRGTSEQVPIATGGGVSVGAGGSIRGRDLVIDGSATTGLFLTGAGSVGELERVTTRDIRVGPDGGSASGLQLTDGASLDVVDLEVADSKLFGVVAWGSGSSLTVDGGVVRDTAVTGEAFFGIGLSLDAGASLQAADLSIEGSVGAGLMARRSTVVLADSTIGSTSASDVPGLGIFLLNSSLGASNLGLVDNAGPGAYLHGPESSAEIDGLVAHDNEFAGLVVQTGAALVLRSGVISDTAPSGVGGGGGVGLLTNGASVDLDVEGVSFSGHRGPGLYLTEPGAFRVVDCSFSDSGTAWADQPGGVLAARGDRPVAGAGRDRAVVGPAPSGQPLRGHRRGRGPAGSVRRDPGRQHLRGGLRVPAVPAALRRGAGGRDRRSAVRRRRVPGRGPADRSPARLCLGPVRGGAGSVGPGRAELPAAGADPEPPSRTGGRPEGRPPVLNRDFET